MNDSQTLKLIDTIISDTIEFGHCDSAEYLRAVIDVISSIMGFKCSAESEKSSLHDFIGAEYDNYMAFRHKHYEKCKNGSDYVVTLQGAGIGESIKVKCPLCGEEENITDMSKW